MTTIVGKDKTCDLIFEGVFLKTLRPKLELPASLVCFARPGVSSASLLPSSELKEHSSTKSPVWSNKAAPSPLEPGFVVT